MTIDTRRTFGSTARRTAGLVLAVLALHACKDSAVPDLNNPSLEGVVNNPTRAQVETMARGLLDADRTSQGGFIRDMEIIGRDAYNLDAADPRWVTELLISLDPGGFGGRHWGDRYRAVKDANILIASSATSASLSAQEKAATAGFAKTIKAMELLAVVQAHDTAGMAADAGKTTDDLSPILCRDAALTAISTLLDDARTNLLAGGSAFPFTLPTGFQGFDTPATFAQVNRAIKARAEIYLGPSGASHYTAALAALGQSFVDTTASLDRGIYHTYSLAAGDQGNPLAQDTATTNFRAHPSVRADAEAGDQRVTRKTAISSTKTYQGVGSNVVFTLYTSPTDPIAIVRNEELILLRAEANIGLNNVAVAMRDINYVRVHSAGLAPKAITTQAAALTQLLYEKRYSLLWESPSRWVDARLYNRLGALPVDQPTHKVHHNFPIPTAEVLGRGGSAKCS